MFPRDEWGEYLRQELRNRLEFDVTDDHHRAHWDELAGALLPEATLDDLITAVGALRQASDPAEPHRVLARLPLPIYITTDPSSLLEKALAAAGKEPQVELCRWNEHVEVLPSIYDDEPNYRPDAQRPLVYQLFGSIQEPDSVVLTEDDYFDYLIGVTSNKELIPGVVRRALAEPAPLVLGFSMDEWDFRGRVRIIRGQGGRGGARGEGGGAGGGGGAVAGGRGRARWPAR